jgi:hypothetical protein
MEQKIITSSSASGLNEKVAAAQKEGFEPVGSHTCVELHHQPKYAGSQHMQTQIRVEYAQTVRKL